MKANNRQAFTLVEMLVVMGIIVLAIALAVPALKYLTGSKSEQAAQNVVSAMLARARSDAVALQQPQGVLFTIDLANDRVTLFQVVQSSQAGDPPGVTYLDLTPDRDPLVLPPGVRAWTIKDTYLPAGFKDPFSPSQNATGQGAYRYLGYNNDATTGAYTGASVTDKALLGGVILFDAQGNLLVTPYGFRFATASPGIATALGGALFTNASTTVPTPAAWPVAGSGPLYLRSQIGFVLFDREAFQNLQASAANKDGNTNTAAAETALDGWLDQNTTPMLISRYTGTITRAE